MRLISSGRQAVPDFKGFGQMGINDAQLLVQPVEDVVAVDVFGRNKP